MDAARELAGHDPRRAGCALLLTLLAVLPGRAADPPSPADLVGSVAADWQLESLVGQPRRLSEFKGHAVVVNFWATWCAPCRTEAKWLSKLYAKYKPQGLEVLGVAMHDASERSEISRFANMYGVNYRILLHGQVIADRYGGVQYLPQTFFIDRSGKIVEVTRGIHDEAALEADIRRILQ